GGADFVTQLSAGLEPRGRGVDVSLGRLVAVLNQTGDGFARRRTPRATRRGRRGGARRRPEEGPAAEAQQGGGDDMAPRHRVKRDFVVGQKRITRHQPFACTPASPTAYGRERVTAS